ncbi:cytochrome c-type biogenesis protein CcmH [Inhella inkyongensis]|uniref:Cytochrome c-type biogenesis protein n=1 Tax=Inhella inkyongensis TaxID=392593 RepID=A0A840S5Q2_9BURK|nr:cytochrome c-type biogenesis protein [Inhella inkyongensis]MBB5205033.1 cytochrome c-type biogenesis protein CcmH [Inhella inkyongensis]
MKALLLCLWMVAAAVQAQATDPLEARTQALAAQLRCLVCQNQTIADSHAPLAVDLKNQVRAQLAAGKQDAEVIDYMTARYGDFVLYKPPVKASTALLWAGPALLVLGALTGLALALRRRAQAAPEAFEPDSDLQDDDLR